MSLTPRCNASDTEFLHTSPNRLYVPIPFIGISYPLFNITFFVSKLNVALSPEDISAFGKSKLSIQSEIVSFDVPDANLLPESHDTDPNLLLRVLKNLWRNVKVTVPYFLLGVALTALYQRYVPSEMVAGLFGANQGFGTLMAAALGVPLYTCGGGAIPLLSAWLGEGMSWGSAIAFMIAGPATKLTNLGAVKIVLGGRNFLYYILFSMLLAAFLGLAVDLIH